MFNWPPAGWFLLIAGALFVIFAQPYGRAIGNGMEGLTPEERRVDTRRHALAARLFGVAGVAGGLWFLLFQ